MNIKTIEQQAEESSLRYRKLDTTVISFSDQISYKHGFVVGANYVLDHLSKTIAVSKDGYLYDNLKKMIEQLKQ